MIESNTKELNTELVAMKEGISELNETFNTMRRDITDKIFDIQRQLNGQLRTEMKVTSENSYCFRKWYMDIVDFKENYVENTLNFFNYKLNLYS
jgi:hypothetical protein